MSLDPIRVQGENWVEVFSPAPPEAELGVEWGKVPLNPKSWGRGLCSLGEVGSLDSVSTPSMQAKAGPPAGHNWGDTGPGGRREVCAWPQDSDHRKS